LWWRVSDAEAKAKAKATTKKRVETVAVRRKRR